MNGFLNRQCGRTNWNSSLLKLCSLSSLCLSWIDYSHTHAHTPQFFVIKSCMDNKADFLEFETTGSTYSPKGKL